MTVVVQSTGLSMPGTAASQSFTLSPTAAGNLVVLELSPEAVTTKYTSVTMSDNGSGNVWNTALINAGASGTRLALIAYCLSISGGVTSVTATFNGGSGNAEGTAAIQEVRGNGGAWSLDQSNTTAVCTATGITITAGAPDVGTLDFVAVAVCMGNGNPATGLDNPPAGYTTAAIEQDDSAHSSAGAAYRINSSAVTDSVTWNASTTLNVGGPGVLASFKSAASALAGLQAPQGRGPGRSPGRTSARFRATRFADVPGIVSGPLTGTSVATSPATAVLTGPAQLVGAGVTTSPGLATLSATGTLAALSVATSPAGAALVGSAALVGTGVSLTPNGAVLGALGVLTGQSVGVSPATAALSGPAALAGLGVTNSPATAILTGSGQLVGMGVAVSPAGANLTVFSAGSMSGQGVMTSPALAMLGSVVTPVVVTTNPGSNPGGGGGGNWSGKFEFSSKPRTPKKVRKAQDAAALAAAALKAKEDDDDDDDAMTLLLT